jgi:phospholipid/cholesterol/gamma-HCH transport system permease protein
MDFDHTSSKTPRLQWLDNGATLSISGPCTMSGLADFLAKITALKHPPKALDLSQLESLDSAGALVLLRLLTTDRRYQRSIALLKNARPEHLGLLQLVADRASPGTALSFDAKSTTLNVLPRQNSTRALVEKVGESIYGFWTQALALSSFFGSINACFWAILVGKRKLRITSIVHHMERTGFDAVPIVCLLCFLVGAVVAFLSATALQDFGAAILTVDIVSVSFLREFGVLLSAILVAGRSGSAFTAEIGSMRSREEVDAIKTLALDPIELLVIPRLVALLMMLPVLSFLAMISGILGGVLVGATALDISPVMFLVRMQERTELYYLWLGLVKAPVFAFLIASIGCLEGFKVSGSAESVGLHTTSSVVQSIFLVIVFDALFAVLFMQLDL